MFYLNNDKMFRWMHFSSHQFRYLTPDMKCGAGLVAALVSQEALQFSWTLRRHRQKGWGSGTCISSLQMLRWTKCPHLSLNLNILVSLRTEVNQCNNCCEKQYWRNLLVVPNKPPPPTSVQIKLNLAHPTWSQYCSDKLWQCGTNWTEKWEF